MAALWGRSWLGGAGVPKAGQGAVRELDGRGSGQGSGLSPPPLEVCLGAQQVSTPPAPLTAAPLPPARNCLLFEGVGEQTPHGNVSPTPGSQESLSPAPAAGLAARRHLLCLLLLPFPCSRLAPPTLALGPPASRPLVAETPGLPAQPA